MKFNNYFILLLFTLFLFSCTNSVQKDFTINGKIKGLTQGTILLEKVMDTLIKPVDSVLVKGNGAFTIGDNIDSPEIYYLRIKEVPDKRILVFGEKGIITVKSKLEKFDTSAKISGSKNHDLLSEYNEMIQKFNDRRLNIFKANFEAERDQNQTKLDSLDKVYKSLIRKRYLYTANYAVNHADMAVAPYLALTELYNANIDLLDTVNNALSENIKNSKYGKQLDRFISVVKKNETEVSDNKKPSPTDLLNN